MNLRDEECRAGNIKQALGAKSFWPASSFVAPSMVAPPDMLRLVHCFHLIQLFQSGSMLMLLCVLHLIGALLCVVSCAEKYQLSQQGLHSSASGHLYAATLYAC